MTVSTTLRADARSAAVARRFVADVLLQRGFPDAGIADAVLLTSEAVTHAALLGGTGIALRVAAEPRMARVEVHLFDPVGGTDDSAALEGPFGSRRQVLQAVAEAWGLVDDDAQSCLWFEIRG